MLKLLFIGSAIVVAVYVGVLLGLHLAGAECFGDFECNELGSAQTSFGLVGLIPAAIAAATFVICLLVAGVRWARMRRHRG